MKLHPAWRIELLGIIEAVKFQRIGSPAQLLWCDGEWRYGNDRMMAPARGVPAARTMTEARRVGTAWINEVEAE